MDNKEILKMAQEDASDIGENERYISNKAVLYGFIAGVILLISMILVEWIIKKTIDCGKPALLFGINSVVDIYNGLAIKNKISIICGVLSCIITLFFIITYLGVLFS